MRAALRAAERGRGKVSPNPAVGAALDLPGWPAAGHLRFGGGHAERNLLGRVGHSARGQAIYVTLEPCSHHGKTGPCVEELINAKVRKVVMATLDPAFQVRGRGAARLRAAGIEVEIGAGAAQALELNLPYFMAQLFGRAWIELKQAISLDGRVADDTGRSRWITGESARRAVHRQRGRADALVVGAGTVLADDPEMTVRDTPGSAPTRIVIDSQLRTPPQARIWQAWQAQSGMRRSSGSGQGRVGLGNFVGEAAGGYTRAPRLVLATLQGTSAARLDRYRAHGWEVWLLPKRGAHLSLSALARRAAREGFHHLLVEAGPGLAQGLLEADLVDALTLYLAPRVLGGRFGWSGGYQARTLVQAPEMEPLGFRSYGEDGCWRLRRRGILDRMAQDVHRIG